VSGSSAVRGLRGAMSWELFAALGEAPIPLTGRPEQLVELVGDLPGTAVWPLEAGKAVQW